MCNYIIERPMRLELEAYQVVKKIVRPGGNSGRVYVPIEWMGKKVKIVLVEPILFNIIKIHFTLYNTLDRF